jgi:hypothetical protein
LSTGYPLTEWFLDSQCLITIYDTTCVTYADYSDPIDVVGSLTSIAELPEESWESEYTSSYCDAIVNLGDECLDAPEVTRFRYRWKVPPCHAGSYYKIMWDEVFFPKEYLDWYDDAQTSANGIEAFDPNANPPPVLPTITPKEWEWTDAALGECDELDPENNFEFREQIESRISPWSESVFALSEGTIELSNARVICYRSEYGTKPQVLDMYPNSYSTDDVDQDGILDEKEPLTAP